MGVDLVSLCSEYVIQQIHEKIQDNQIDAYVLNSWPILLNFNYAIKLQDIPNVPAESSSEEGTYQERY